MQDSLTPNIPAYVVDPAPVKAPDTLAQTLNKHRWRRAVRKLNPHLRRRNKLRRRRSDVKFY